MKGTAVTDVQTQWDQVGDYELPSVNESKAASASAFEDEIEDGTYQFAIVDMSPPLANNFLKKDGTPGNPRRGLTLRVVQSDEPSDIGLQTIQYMTESTHPKSAMYQLIRVAAFGGNIPADKRPKLIDLRDKQFKASLVTGPSEKDPTKMIQRLQGLLPAKKNLPITERQVAPRGLTAEEAPAPWDDDNFDPGA
jgi:hypothetical protein